MTTFIKNEVQQIRWSDEYWQYILTTNTTEYQIGMFKMDVLRPRIDYRVGSLFTKYHRVVVSALHSGWEIPISRPPINFELGWQLLLK